MEAAMSRVGCLTSGLQVDAFFTRRHPDGTIQFEPMAASRAPGYPACR